MAYSPHYLFMLTEKGCQICKGIQMPRRKYRSFEEARLYVQTLKIKNQVEWFKYYRSRDKPPDIPSAAPKVYRDKGEISWGYWLGTGNVSTNNRRFWSYEDARGFVNALGIKTIRQWRAKH